MYIIFKFVNFFLYKASLKNIIFTKNPKNVFFLYNQYLILSTQMLALFFFKYSVKGMSAKIQNFLWDVLKMCFLHYREYGG